jgi:phage gp37-like protein
MNPIATAEDAIIAICDAALQAKVRPMESLPGVLTMDVLRTIAARTPAVYVCYLGGRAGVQVTDSAQHQALFAVYVITDHASGNVDRRRGDARQIGAYDILAILVPVLNDHTVPGVGSLNFQRIENLFSVDLDKKGVSIYAATFELPMSFSYQLDETTLDDFITYDATHSISADVDVPASQDVVTLDQ